MNSSRGLRLLSDVVDLDLHLSKPDAHMEVCKALRFSSDSKSTFRIRPHLIDVTSLGVPRINVLLELCSPQVREYTSVLTYEIDCVIMSSFTFTVAFAVRASAQHSHELHLGARLVSSST